MNKKTDKNLDVDMQADAAEQDASALNDDVLEHDISNAASADAEPENATPEKTSEVEADQDDDPLSAMTAERDALKDQLLRALADTENKRRRSER